MNTLTDLLLGVGQPRVSHFPDLCTLLYTYLSTLDYWTKIGYYLFTQTSPVAHTSALTPKYIKSQKLPNWPISKELGLGRMLLPHWKLLLIFVMEIHIAGKIAFILNPIPCYVWGSQTHIQTKINESTKDFLRNVTEKLVKIIIFLLALIA